MAIEDAVNGLTSEANAPIEWAFGDLLRLWTRRENWRSCMILQHLEANHPNLAIWNDIIQRTRVALADEQELTVKSGTLLSPSTVPFNDVMEDFIAEMLGAQYLHSLGHTEIHFVADDDEIHTDLKSRCGEHLYITEAKNLREPLALTKVAFTRWNQNRSSNRHNYNFTAN